VFLCDVEGTLKVTEIYLSLQGESTWAGLPCIFVRLTGCPLRCTYCDSAYAFYGGEKLPLEQILAKVDELAGNPAVGRPLVEITGGEPLAQPNCVPLMQALLARGYTVLLETSGAISVASVPREVHKILDVKCPSSGEEDRNDLVNLQLIAAHDEVKFVIGSREDYEFARSVVREHRLATRCRAVLFSAVFGAVEPAALSGWMLEDHLWDVRLQLQMHKYIWHPDAKGV
jgi:7-carboxy-7-deazaguanine synthase